jgi:hypothetical protein
MDSSWKYPVEGYSASDFPVKGSSSYLRGSQIWFGQAALLLFLLLWIFFSFVAHIAPSNTSVIWVPSK